MENSQQEVGRPPYVVFEYQPVEDREASLKEGRYVAKDKAFAKITRPGSRDTHVEEAEVWLKKLAERVRMNLCPPTWLMHFQAAFDMWKKGEELPSEGTPIKTWTVISPAQAQAIIRAGFRTVEDLAEAGVSEVSAIGTGGLNFQVKAKQWIEDGKNRGASVERVVALEQQVKDLIAANTSLQAKLNTLKAAEAK